MYYFSCKDEKHPFHVAEYGGGGGTRGLRKTQTDDVLHHREGDVGWVGIRVGINAFLISFLARVRGRKLGIVRRQRTGGLQRQSTSGGSTSRADWKKILNRFEGKNNNSVRHVTGNDRDYLRKIPRVVW